MFSTGSELGYFSSTLSNLFELFLCVVDLNREGRNMGKVDQHLKQPRGGKIDSSGGTVCRVVQR